MNAPSTDHYAILDVPATADAVAIRAAYRRLALALHPDRAGAASTYAFQRLAEAYAVLSDPAHRARFDARAARTRPPPPPRSSSTATPSRAPRNMLHRLTGQLASVIGRGAARRAAGGVIELLLTAEEATSGGFATISVPDPALLNHWVTIPPGAVDGTLFRSVAGAPPARSDLVFRLRVAR